MKSPNYYTKFEKIQYWLGQKPDVLAMMLVSVLTFILLFCGLFVFYKIINVDMQNILPMSLFVASFASVGMFIGGVAGVKIMRERSNDAVGLELTNRERVDLNAWIRSGRVPNSQRLRPHLGSYLDWTTSIVNGTSFQKKGIAKNLYFYGYIFIALTQLLSIIISIMDGDGVPWLACIFVIFSVFIVKLTAPGSKSPSSFFLKLNRRQIERIDLRRAELKKDYGHTIAMEQDA